MMTPEQLIELAERCEAVGEGSRELDAAIGLAVGLPTRDRTGEPGWHGRYFEGVLPSYTSSLDAAMQLVPEGWGFTVERSIIDGARALCYTAQPSVPFAALAATPALALTAASLRSLASQKDKSNGS